VKISKNLKDFEKSEPCFDFGMRFENVEQPFDRLRAVPSRVEGRLAEGRPREIFGMFRIRCNSLYREPK